MADHADITTVRIGAWGKDGEPHPSIDAAVCAKCGWWADDVWFAAEIESDGEMFNSRVRRETHVVVYTCDIHRQEIADELLDQYGLCSNMLGMELAREAERVSRRHRRREKSS